MQKKALYYLPVKEEFISEWEYYKVELDMLTELFSEVIVCDSFWKLFKHVKNSDLIYCWWWHRSVLALALGKLFRTKVFIIGALHVFDLSGAPDYCNSRWWLKFLNKFALKNADCNLFISYDQFNQVTSHINVKNPVTLRSSVMKETNFDVKKVISKRKRIQIQKPENEKNTVLFMSTCWHTTDQHTRKGIYEILGAMAYLNARTDVAFERSIIGRHGDGIPRLRQKIKELGLERKAIIHLDVSQENKDDFYLKSDLYIQPSWCEGFGNAVLESMSFGLPALVSRYTAQPEVVGDTGYIAMDMRSKTIGKKLLKFVSLSESQKQEMSQLALERVDKNFTYSIRLNFLRKILCEQGILDV